MVFGSERAARGAVGSGAEIEAGAGGAGERSSALGSADDAVVFGTGPLASATSVEADALCLGGSGGLADDDTFASPGTGRACGGRSGWVSCGSMFERSRANTE